MNIAVIGCNGFIGSELVDYLLARGNKVIGYSRKKVINDNRSFVNVIIDSIEDKNNLYLKNCEALVLLASERLNFTYESLINNLNIAEKYFLKAKECNIENIVFTSSRSVYSNKKLPWKESDENIPINLYGVSKKMIDELAIFYNKIHKLNIKCLRLAQVIGMKEVKGFLINTFIDNAIAKKTLVIYGKGIGKRQYIYIKDVCRAIEVSLKHAEVKGIFNLGMKENIMIKDLAEIINNVFNNDGNIKYELDKQEDVSESLMDVSKIKEVMNFETEYDIIKTFQDIRKSTV